MLKKLGSFFTQNIGLKITALILALALWFYIVNELKGGSEEDKQFLSRVLPMEGMAAKKLAIRPVLIGRPRPGYFVNNKQLVVAPEFCIVVGSKELLEKIRFVYTMPIDIASANKAFTKTVALSSISPGVYMEETLVQVTIPIEKENP